jgi:F0F1-type ATP synthase epsilon subunit
MSKPPATVATMYVKVISPTQTFYDGPAESVSGKNKVGAFDILPDHANFFSLLVACSIVINTGGQKLSFPIKHGIVKVSHNKVTLFIYLPDD